jgi:hypothetical protein
VQLGSETLTYKGMMLSDKLQRAIVLDLLPDAGLTVSETALPAERRLKSEAVPLQMAVLNRACHECRRKRLIK